MKVEQVASQHDETCNVRRIDGPVFVRGVAGGAAGPLPTSGGAVSVESKQVNADIDAFLFYEREVVLDDASVSLLHAFNGCGRLEREAVAEPAALSTGVLLKRLEAARACRQVRGDAVAAEQARLEAELLKRRAGSESGTYLPGAKRLQGFEEAVAAYPPRFTLTDDGASDADKGIELLNGQNVLVRGRVQTGLSPNIGVISYGKPRGVRVLAARRAVGQRRLHPGLGGRGGGHRVGPADGGRAHRAAGESGVDAHGEVSGRQPPMQ
ncbi:MAG: hypothetical protein IPJ65_26205 [Archangiaceae bacterium]|nr:hypothetical protein [Archangiaceae bacterium]